MIFHFMHVIHNDVFHCRKIMDGDLGGSCCVHLQPNSIFTNILYASIRDANMPNVTCGLVNRKF